MEPKSIHTWFEPLRSDILKYEIAVCIDKFPKKANKKWLFYFSLQVNFTQDDEWGHGGLQWAEVPEFIGSGNMGINWGGGSQSKGYASIGRHNYPFKWGVGIWYHYQVLRFKSKVEGGYKWGFRVQNTETNIVIDCGTIFTKSEFIRQASVFTETGYGVECETAPVIVLWRNPRFGIAGGIGSPEQGVATYNGTCKDPHNTNQDLITLNPKVWFHKLNSKRTVENYSPIWR